MEVNGYNIKQGANLHGADLRGTNLHGADLRGANLREVNLEGADLRGANLREAYLQDANLRGANLRGANLRCASLRGTNLSSTKGILSFTGEKHLLIYFKYDNKHYFKIGCITKTKEEWLEDFNFEGKNHSYGEDTIQLYGDVIKLFSQYNLI